jgi:hypothetical protein
MVDTKARRAAAPSTGGLRFGVLVSMMSLAGCGGSSTCTAFTYSNWGTCHAHGVDVVADWLCQREPDAHPELLGHG